jgi:hypothetical protein
MTITTLAIGVRDGRVIYSFPRSTTEVALDAETARQIAESTARAAYECRYGRVSINGGSLIADQVRNRLITRATLVLSGLQGRPSAYQAAQLVDIILSEVA